MLSIMLDVQHSKMGKMVIKFKEFSLVVEQIGSKCLTRVRKKDLTLEDGKQKNIEKTHLMNHLSGEWRSIT